MKKLEIENFNSRGQTKYGKLKNLYLIECRFQRTVEERIALLRNDVINFNMQFSLHLLSLVFQALHPPTDPPCVCKLRGRKNPSSSRNTKKYIKYTNYSKTIFCRVSAFSIMFSKIRLCVNNPQSVQLSLRHARSPKRYSRFRTRSLVSKLSREMVQVQPGFF